MYKFPKFIMDKTPEYPKSFNEWKNYCVEPHFSIKDGISNEIKEQAKIAQQKLGGFDEFLKNAAQLTMRCRASEIKEWINKHPGYMGYLIIDDYDSHLATNFKEKFISTLHQGKYLLNSEDTEKAYQVFCQCLETSI